MSVPFLHAQKDSALVLDTVVKQQIAVSSIKDSLQPTTHSLKKAGIDSLLKGSLRQSLLKDSLRQDSTQKINQIPAKSSIDTSTYRQFMAHPYLSMEGKPVFMLIDYRKERSKDFLFYLLLAIVTLLALIKVAFPKYFRNLFLLFFQTSLRQKQTREQLLQDQLASLLINFLFLVSTGLFITLLIQYKGWSGMDFWVLYAYVTALLLVIYSGKYLFILFAGWVFNNKEAAQGYIFLVSMVNRIMGVLLIPLTILMALGNENILAVVATLSMGLVALLLLYRYLVSFGSLRNELKINAFHFFLYLCAVEVLPMLLIYKLLVNYIG